MQSRTVSLQKTISHHDQSGYRRLLTTLLLSLLLLPLISVEQLSAWDDRELLVSNSPDLFMLPVVLSQQQVCITLSDLIAASGCSYYEAPPFHHLIIGDSDIRIMQDNCFYSNAGSISQLPVAPHASGEELLLPLALLTQLSVVNGTGWEFDESARELVVRHQSGVNGFSIAPLPDGLLVSFHLDRIQIYDGYAQAQTARLRFARSLVPRASLPEVIDHSAVSGFRVTPAADSLLIEFDFSSEYQLLEIFENDDQGHICFLLSSSSPVELVQELPPWDAPTGWSLDTIILDAGHGGKDPGAVSPRGMYEKTITLDIVLELEKLLLADGRFAVHLTRRDDRFLTLKQRTRFANEHEGKLFISVHCNAARNRSARGFETYLLRTARNEHALDVALKENGVVRLENAPELYDAMRTDNYILMSMAQSAFVQESAQFALQLKPHLSTLIRPHSGGINQAGFYVLWGASMPAVLLETGFLTNRRDYNLLKSPTGREDIARAVYDSILEFKQLYENN